jgi:hypothetical protein
VCLRVVRLAGARGVARVRDKEAPPLASLVVVTRARGEAAPSSGATRATPICRKIVRRCSSSAACAIFKHSAAKRRYSSTLLIRSSPRLLTNWCNAASKFPGLTGTKSKSNHCPSEESMVGGSAANHPSAPVRPLQQTCKFFQGHWCARLKTM